MAHLLANYRENGFFRSNLYLLLVAAIVVTTWALEIPLLGVLLFLALILLNLATQKSLIGLLPLLATMTFLFPNEDMLVEKFYLTFILVAAVIAIVGVLIYMIVRRVRVRFGPPLVGALLMLVAAAVGGLTTEGHFASPVYWMGVGMTGLVVILYFALSNTVKEYDPRYFAKVFVVIMVIMIAETWINVLTQPDPISHILYKGINLGWGINNNVGLVLIMVSPFALYCACKTKAGFPYILLYVLSFLTVLVTYSRGAILMFVLVLVPSLFTMIRLSKKPALNAASLAVISLAILAAYLTQHAKLYPIVEGLLHKGFGDSGRFNLYEQAFIDWKAHNIWIGAGYGYGSLLDINIFPYFNWYHNHYLQMLSNLGIFGLVAILIHVGQRIYYILKVRSKFAVFALWGTLAAGMYGFIDVSYFTPYFLLPMILILVMTENGVRSAKTDAFPKDELLV